MNLKVYTCYLGWKGDIVAIASSEEEARGIMEKESVNYKYHKDQVLEVHEIKNGFFYEVDNS